MPGSKDFAVDSDLVRTLAALLDETGLTEIEYAVGERRVRVARGGAAAAPPAVVATVMPAIPAAAMPAAAAEHPGAVKSPMVGTAYLAPEPEAAPFVAVGDRVTEGQVILIIEAMKVMNQIRAPRSGLVRAIAVGDGEPVEFGQVLMVVE